MSRIAISLPLSKPLDQLVEEGGLGGVYFLAGRWDVEPFGLVDFGVVVEFAGVRGPFLFECVAEKVVGVEIAFDGEGVDDLAAFLAYLLELEEIARHTRA